MNFYDIPNGQVTGDIANKYAHRVQELPREPKFYPNELPQTSCNIPMPNVKPLASNGDRVCDTCIKEDVCVLCNELNKAINEIKDISGRTGVFIDTTVKCQKWSGKIANMRNI